MEAVFRELRFWVEKTMATKKKRLEQKTEESEHIPESKKTHMRRFYLLRMEDESGVSGEGIVCEGVVFSNGMVAATWLTGIASFENCLSIDAFETIHGHGGKTKVVYIDGDPND